ncbi:unnamed protein product [Acanthoscelides obtectus]|uniref:Uncharacterized protein n=1 Tax=Acanthoscelides obtectus TaxID=200917 RepID=A0A9P0LL44_ACAOB|nr:unnamed protein product [Acanthoscelides obtectus]CAK1660029.1 hypothetical protein AOBTE_LOCUS21828 [Acanthoscelides obtectus]
MDINVSRLYVLKISLQESLLLILKISVSTLFCKMKTLLFMTACPHSIILLLRCG